MFRALWEIKKREEEDLIMKEMNEIRELNKNKIFGRYFANLSEYKLKVKTLGSLSKNWVVWLKYACYCMVSGLKSKWYKTRKGCKGAKIKFCLVNISTARSQVNRLEHILIF